MLRKSLLVFGIILVCASLAAACSKCGAQGQCIDGGHGCACDPGNPCTSCGACVPILGCTFPCTLPEGKKLTLQQASYLVTALQSSHAESADQLKSAWRVWLKNSGLEERVGNYSHVMKVLIQAEIYALNDPKRRCGPVHERGGSFSLTNFRHYSKGDPVIEWEATVDAAKGAVTYDITEQPDKSLPDRLVLTKNAWTIYKSDGNGGYKLIANGE